jgi:hypothetical protein
MRTTTIVHFGQKVCAWEGATSEATGRRNEVFYLQLPHARAAQVIQSLRYYEAV